MFSGHRSRGPRQIQQEAGHGPDVQPAHKGILSEPALALDRLRGTARLWVVPRDLRQD